MTPDPASSPARPSHWFEDEGSLIDVVRGDAALTTPVISGYHSLRELKRGGQGVVFRARQQFTNRDVAIKVLLAGSLAAPSARRRFEREAELAASLRHPNIVRVFDSGVTPEGAPYLIMELVDGGPFITGDQPPDATSLRSRITAMLKVVDAVGHAHQRGVLHRDLKPGNLRIDETGEPRVLDFGLAIGIGDAPPGATSFSVSATGQLVGSLPWMSPEQLEDPHTIDTRTDIYALGVILHQLTTAKLPYDTGGTLSTAIFNIRTFDAPLASSLNPAADADLSTIIARCLAKDRERRYPSAAELKADLTAWLAGEPIRARRDSAWYTLRKKASRYRTVAWVGGGSACALAAAAVVSVNAAAQASRERDVANAALRRAETVTDVLVKMIVSPDPTKEGRDVRVIEVLDEASRHADAAFAGDSTTEVGVRLALSQSYTALGQSEAGLREALRARERLGAQAAPEDHVAIDSAAAAALHELGRPAEALADAQRAYDRALASFDEADDRVTDARAVLAACLEASGDMAQAIPHKQAVLTERRRSRPADHLDIVDALNSLAVSHASAGDLASAIPLLREAHASILRTDGPSRPNAVVTAINLGTLLKQKGELAEALPILDQALEGATLVWGPEHLQTLSAAANRATTLTDLERPAESAAEFERILEIQRRILSPDHPRILITLSNLGSAKRDLGDLSGAEPLFREAAEGAIRTLGPGHIHTVMFRGNLGELLTHSGRPREAIPVLQAVAADAERDLGTDNWITGTVLLNLGRAHADLGEHQPAADLYTKAYFIFEKSLGRNHYRSTSAASGLADVFESLGDAKQAAEWRAKTKP